MISTILIAPSDPIFLVSTIKNIWKELWQARIFVCDHHPSLLQSCYPAKEDLICAKLPNLFFLLYIQHKYNPCSSPPPPIEFAVFFSRSQLSTALAPSLNPPNTTLLAANPPNFLWSKDLQAASLHPPTRILEGRNCRHGFGKESARPNFSSARLKF